MQLSDDERTGDAEGHDEYILVNGGKWSDVKRLVVYIYIYDGAARWSEINPQIILDVPGENDLVVSLGGIMMRWRFALWAGLRTFAAISS